MSSILTNVSAMTALKTLSMTNKSLELTQRRISTGYEVGEAADNAAYWSIATTMRSDNKALGTVQDALGLGAATIDVAYTAMNASKEVMDEIKTKLVAAKQPGIDKAKVQSEVKQLQEQLQGISSSASFSGSNWLSVDSSSPDYKAIEQIISSFSRNNDGSITIGTVDIDITTFSLLDADPVVNSVLEGGTSGTGTSTPFTWTQGTFADGDTLTLNINVDGAGAAPVNIVVADAANFDLRALVAGLNANGTGFTAATSDNGNSLVLTSDSTGATSSIQLTGVTTTQVTATTPATIGFTTIALGSGAATGGGVLDIDITNATGAQLDWYITRVDTMNEGVITAAADLGAIKSRISMQQDFAKQLLDAIDRGVGQLVDANMSEESTKLQALQVQQQLGIQALSIANGNAQTILTLFQG
ncbi:flagellin [Oricola cellulosilytica]|uniref:Flagellin n=1 Tax=Oricola cellulosilytica TaxID=1429082 RepID=A0A4R0PEH0_9HYPH|nr:flagellin [Oricola cellulosilytica]TCD16205.1 flagellin C [Oricola cellulosilytica]